MSAQQRKSCCAKIKLDRSADARTWRYTERGNKIIPYYVTSTVVRVRMYPGWGRRNSRGRWLATTAPFSLLLFAPLPPRPSTGILLLVCERPWNFSASLPEFFCLLFDANGRASFLAFSPVFDRLRNLEKFGVPRFGGRTRNLISRGSIGSSLGNCFSWNEFFWIELIFPFVFSLGEKNLCFRYISSLVFSRISFFFLPVVDF